MSIVRIATITAQCDNCGAKESSSTIKANEDCELLCVPRITPDILTGIKARLEETTS